MNQKCTRDKNHSFVSYMKTTLPLPPPLAVAMVRPIVYIATAPIERNEKICKKNMSYRGNTNQLRHFGSFSNNKSTGRFWS